MASSRLSTLFVILLLVILGVPDRSHAQTFTASDTKQDEAIRKIQKLLDEPLFDANLFQMEMPLAKLLAGLELQLPKEKWLALRIDNDAFGPKLAEVAAVPIGVASSPPKTSLRSILERAKAKSKIEFDYRIGIGEVVITTPQKALYAAVYDVRDLIGGPTAPFRNAEGLILNLVNSLDEFGATKASKALETIETLNNTKLVILTNATRHADVAGLLQSMRRMADVAVSVETRLYEVDDAFYARLKKAKRVSTEELERQFLKGVVDNSLFDLLKTQKMIFPGETTKPTDHETCTLLSWHRVIKCLAGPDQLRKGSSAGDEQLRKEAKAQIVLAGVSFLAVVKASPDRRSVQMRFTEKATELQEIQRSKVLIDNAGNEVDADTPTLKENTQTQVLSIPDGGSILVPVLYRQNAVRDKNRWWVLKITPRIYIDEEEQSISKDTLEAVLPLVVADVLKNPLLKTSRDFYGTPDDRRFAVVSSAAWTWTENLRPDVPGHQLAPVVKAGKRLLGIRIDSLQWLDGGNLTLAVTLVNVGGRANGAAIGGCTIHYTVRQSGESWTVELAEK